MISRDIRLIFEMCRKSTTCRGCAMNRAKDGRSTECEVNQYPCYWDTARIEVAIDEIKAEKRRAQRAAQRRKRK